GLESVLSTAWPVVINFVIDYVRSVSGARRLQNAGHLLHQCCTSLNADASVLENILKDCTDVDCRNEDGRTPLVEDVRNRNFEIATCLLSHGADINAFWVHKGQKVHILYEHLVNNVDLDIVPLKYLRSRHIRS